VPGRVKLPKSSAAHRLGLFGAKHAGDRAGVDDGEVFIEQLEGGEIGEEVRAAGAEPEGEKRAFVGIVRVVADLLDVQGIAHVAGGIVQVGEDALVGVYVAQGELVGFAREQRGGKLEIKLMAQDVVLGGEDAVDGFGFAVHREGRARGGVGRIVVGADQVRLGVGGGERLERGAEAAFIGPKLKAAGAAADDVAHGGLAALDHAVEQTRLGALHEAVGAVDQGGAVLGHDLIARLRMVIDVGGAKQAALDQGEPEEVAPGGGDFHHLGLVGIVFDRGAGGDEGQAGGLGGGGEALRLGLAFREEGGGGREEGDALERDVHRLGAPVAQDLPLLDGGQIGRAHFFIHRIGPGEKSAVERREGDGLTDWKLAQAVVKNGGGSARVGEAEAKPFGAVLGGEAQGEGWRVRGEGGEIEGHEITDAALAVRGGDKEMIGGGAGLVLPAAVGDGGRARKRLDGRSARAGGLDAGHAAEQGKKGGKEQAIHGGGRVDLRGRERA
jgi:hypothetical protein